MGEGGRREGGEREGGEREGGEREGGEGGNNLKVSFVRSGVANDERGNTTLSARCEMLATCVRRSVDYTYQILPGNIN